MTVATEKLEPSSSRHTLVRIRPGRSIASYMTATGTPNVYEMTWPFSSPPVEISSQGVENYYTQVDTLSLAATEFTYNESTRLLQLYDTTPSFPTSGIISVAYYYLFFCSHKRGDLDYFEDPDDTNSTRRNWEGRLLSDPAVSASFDDILNGVFSIADTSIALMNTDGHFEQFLGDNDSFHRKEFKAWLFINGLKQKVFSGNVASISINDDSFNLNVYDQFSKLKAPAFMGDADSHVRIAAAGTPKDAGKPIPLILATDSYALKRGLGQSTFGLSGGTLVESAVFSEGPEAYCSSYSGNLTTSNNRQWDLCRLLATRAIQTFGTLTRATTDGGLNIITYWKFSSYTNVRIGDTIRWNEAGTDYYGIILAYGTNIATIMGNTYDIVALSDTGVAATNTSVVTASPCVGVIIFGDEVTLGPAFRFVFAFYGRDYTIAEANTAGGHKRVRLTFVNNFEALVVPAGFGPLDPNQHQVKFNIRSTGTHGHAAMAKRILDKADVDTLAASFTAAEAALVETTAFSIPNIDETDYSDYSRYLRDLLASTLGYVWMNNDGEAEYDLLAAPAAGDSKDENIALDRGASATLEYQDIVSALIPDNPHLPLTDEKDLNTTPSDKARYLHEINNEQPFRHVMSTVTNERIQEIVALKSQRQVTYSFETATDDIDTVLGQDVTLDTPRLLGSGNVKVTGIEKSADKVRITATDLLGL